MTTRSAALSSTVGTATRTAPKLGLAMAIAGGEGLCSGLFVLTYSFVVGQVGAAYLGLNAKTIALAYPLLTFALMWGLQIRTGEFGDKRGIAAGAMRVSTLTRTMWFAALATLASWQNAAAFTICATAGAIAFAVAYTMHSGNFQKWVWDEVRTNATTPQGRRIADGAFAASVAIRHLAVLGGAAIALACIGDVQVDDVLAAPALATPYWIGAAVSLSFYALVIYLVPRQGQPQPTTPTGNDPAQLRSLAFDAKRKSPYLENVFRASALIYGLHQAVIILVPLYILLAGYSFGQKFTVALIVYGPAFLGAATLAVLALRGIQKRREATSASDPTRHARRGAIAFSLTITAFAVLASVRGPQYFDLLLLAPLIAARFTHGPLDSHLQRLAVEASKRLCPHGAATLNSIGERYKMVGGAIVLIVALIVNGTLTLERGSSGPESLMTALAIEAALIGIASAWLLRRQTGLEDS